MLQKCSEITQRLDNLEIIFKSEKNARIFSEKLRIWGKVRTFPCPSSHGVQKYFPGYDGHELEGKSVHVFFVTSNHAEEMFAKICI